MGLLSPSPSSELLLPSRDTVTTAIMGMEAIVEDTMDMGATEDTTTARGPLMLMLRLRLSQPPLLSRAMVITEDTSEDITLTDTDTLLLTPMDIMVIMARGLLMPSLPMVTMVTVTDTALTDTEAMAMVATEDTTTVEKFQKFMLTQSD